MNCGRQLAIALVSWMLAGVAPAAESFTTRVIRVKDGDSLVVLHDNKQIGIRLEGIDCPESGQAFGQQAKQAAVLRWANKVRDTSGAGQLMLHAA